MSKKTIVVAGGAGFLGSHLCERLVGQGHRVICIDSLITGSLSNIAGLLARGSFEFVNHDVIDPIEIPGGVDEIFNLACPASPAKYRLDPIHTFKSCVMGAINLLDLARDKGATILQASTSEVYGDPAVSPQPETYHGSVNPFGPRACYDEGKRAAETLFHDYRARHGVRIKVARIFNTYGPRMDIDDGRVVSNFIVQALTGQDLTIYGTGAQTRSFCYVDDLIAGLTLLMASPVDQFMPINHGNPGEFTVRELADMVLAKTGSRSRIAYHDLPKDDPKRRRPDTSLARSVLGWEPKAPLSTGLDRSIAYFAARLGTSDDRAARVA